MKAILWIHTLYKAFWPSVRQKGPGRTRRTISYTENRGIFHDNENETLYDRQSKKTLAHARCRRNSFCLNPLNFSDAAVQLISIGSDLYHWPDISVHHTSSVAGKKSLLNWLGHSTSEHSRSTLRLLLSDLSTN